MKNWDAIVIGAGIIGLSLGIDLRKRGMTVLVVEKGQPGREASWAAGGMLADYPLEMPYALRDLAEASARMYPEFVRELEAASGIKIDLRSEGALVFGGEEHAALALEHPLPRPLHELEPRLRAPAHAPICLDLRERSVDPRQLLAAAIGAARQRGVEFACGEAVSAIETWNGKAEGVRTTGTGFSGGFVVNCAGAWAGQITRSPAPKGAVDRKGLTASLKRCPDTNPNHCDATNESDVKGVSPVPTRPVKGQMLCLAVDERESVRHVVRTPDVYLIPRSDGRLVIGATQEEAGFDKQLVPETIQRLQQAAIDLVPRLADAPVLESWAGLRPGTPDKLPILGGTSLPGYFVATGHFRDGILLAPMTARVMGQLICGETPEIELAAFGIRRF